MTETDLLPESNENDTEFEESLATKVALIKSWATWHSFLEDHDQAITESGKDEIPDWLEPLFVEVGSDEWNKKLATFDYIDDWFEPYTAFSVENGSGEETSLELARGYANKGVETDGSSKFPKSGGSMGAEMDSVAIRLEDWQGDAADEFYNWYIKPFGELHAIRLNMIDELLSIITIQREAISRAKNDVLTVADLTLECLEKKEMPNLASESSADSLTVLGVVAAVAGVATAETVALPIVFAIVGGLANAGASKLSVSAEGATVEEILNSLKSQLVKIPEGINSAVADLESAIDEDIEKVSGSIHGLDKRVVGPKPDPLKNGYSGFRYPDGLTEG